MNQKDKRRTDLQGRCGVFLLQCPNSAPRPFFDLDRLPPMLRVLPVLRACAFALLAAAPLAAQARAPHDSLLLGPLAWREIGPFRGGRSVAVAGSAARPLEYWMGTTGGGVFKTTDGGFSWQPASDRYFGGTVGAIGVAESNPDVVYVGTGEFPIRGNVSHGDGVYKTTDGGKTWTYVGLVETRQISRVRVHPKDPNTVYVGAQGEVWGASSARGVYRTTDGGKAWKRVLFRNDSTGVADLAMDPSDPKVLYAALWQVHRRPWKLESGGAGSGLFKTTDGGDTWTEITRNPGLPRGIWGNVGITVSPANPKRLWALVEHDSGGVFRSDDAGATWTRINDERKLRQRAWYYTKLYADSKDENRVYASNVSFQRSTDGGKTWQNIRTPHGDSHDFWMAPNDNQRMIEGNDGGANVSVTAGRAWTGQQYATAQFYHVITTNHFPYRICGAQQDNSTLCGPSRADGGIALADWYDAGGGESGYIAPRPDNPDITYAGSYGGYLTRKDAKTGLERNIMPWPLNPMGHAAADLKFRFQWTYPIVVSQHNPNVLYAAANQLFRTDNEGASWTVISPDLTRHDPATLGASGGPITKDQTSVEYYATIFTLAESPRDKAVLWAGSDDGLVHVTRDGGTTWVNVTPKDMAPFTRVSIIDASTLDAGTAYVAANRFQLQDMRPYLWKTTDFGATWSRIDTGLPATEFTRVIRADPVRRGLLFAGTERGVWTSLDDGATWVSLRRNLPAVPVHDLAIKDGDLIAGTHGRSFWVLDDISALRTGSAALLQQSVALLAPRESYRIEWGGGRGVATGANPSSGITVQYWLKQQADSVAMEFLDAQGKVLRRFSSELDSTALADSLGTAAKRDSVAQLGVMRRSLDEAFGRDADGERRGDAARPSKLAGLQRFSWDMRVESGVGFKGMILWGGSTRGPMVPPGTYTVRLIAGGVTDTISARLLADPRSGVPQADLVAQYEFLLRVRNRVTDANNTVRTIRNVKAQLDQRVAAATPGRRATIRRAADVLDGKLSAVEARIYQVKNRSGQDPLNYPIQLNNEIAALVSAAGQGDGAPTAQSRAILELLSGRLDVELAALRPLLEGDLAAVNALLKREGLAAIVPGTAEFAGRPGDAEEDGAAEGEAEEAGEEQKRW